MVNLEELTLYLFVVVDNGAFIDGIYLYDDVLIHMPRLNKLTFSINTGVIRDDDRAPHFSSNEYIQSTFTGRGYGQIRSYVDVSPTRDVGRCHVYSIPYQFERFCQLNNSFQFQDDVFDKVQHLTMRDTQPFEHKFFELTSQCFPCIKELIVFNEQSQKEKSDSSKLLRFPHLIRLELPCAHIDYVKQFLLTKNTDLPRLLDLHMSYESLRILTNNFTNHSMCLNGAQLKSLDLFEPFVAPETFHLYFPLL